jgi:hypothetical protein
MEPIRHTKTARFKSLKIYRPELDELVGLFQKSCQRVVISDNDHRYDSLNEMKDHVGIKIKNLDIRGENPGVHFLLNQKEYTPGSSTPQIFNELRTEEISDPADTLFWKVKELLSQHERLNPGAFAGPAIILLMLTAILLAFSPRWWASGFRTHFVVVGGCLFVMTLVLISAAATVKANCLSLESEANSASFFVRNREDCQTGRYSLHQRRDCGISLLSGCRILIST